MDFTSDVRATLLYFDLFEYPLTIDELFQFMPAILERNDFADRIAGTGISASNGYYQLGSAADLSIIRRSRERKARKMLAAAEIVGEFIRYFPFVRGAFLSGSLSKGVDEGGADIDLFIVASEERLWICRSILTLFKKSVLLNKKKFLCPNYLVTEQHLDIPERNLFTATELITLRPLYNPEMLSRLIRANDWVGEFYPNFKPPPAHRPSHAPVLQKIFEQPMRDGYTGKIDRKLMNYYTGVWKKRYPDFPEDERDFLFRTTPFASKVHPNDYQSKVLGLYEERLKEEHLFRKTRLPDD